MRSERKAKASCRDTALGLLARREHSRRELDQKLSFRGYASDDVRQTLDELESQRLLDEGRFVESYVRSRRERGFGPLRIRAELETRGVGAALIAEHLDAADEAWLTLAREQYHKRFGADRITDYRERVRRAQFLQRRGFPAEMARDVVGGW